MSKIATKIANGALKLALPSINRKLSQAIQKKGLDPYQHVMHYEEEIGGSTVSGKVSVGLNNLRGLSSLQIESLQFTDVELHFGKEDSSAKGTFSLQFTQDLTANAEGKVTGKVSVFSHSETLDADLSNAGSTLQGEADFTLGSIRKLEIKSFHLDTLNLKVGESHVHVHGSLGIFDPLLNDVIELITNKFNEELVGHITSALKGVIQDSVNEALPIELGG